MSALLDSMQAGFAALPPERVEAGGLGDLRRAALRGVIAAGLPSQRDERWKYTALRALSARSFATAAESPRLHPAALGDIPAPRLVLVNGVFDASLSDVGDLRDGLQLGPLSAAMDAAPAPPAPMTASPADAFALLNAALATEGVRLSLAPGVELQAPVHLVFVGSPASADLAAHLRHEIELGADAAMTVIEHHFAVGAHRHLVNHFSRVMLGARARLTHARLQDEDAGATVIARSDVVLGDHAAYRRVDLELGASLSRHELNVALAGESAQVSSGGAMLAGGKRHIDTRLGIEHRARDTSCDLRWRGLAGDRGRVAFHGGITIHAGADGSDARLSNKNLLLSDGAEVDTQPVLQIHADEVKAAHGATVGRLDPTALFYLRSRGIPAAQARALLTLAFCREALSSGGDLALIETLSPRLEARLAALETLP